MLAFLLLATGEVGWTSPVVLLLLLVCAVGVAALVAALVIAATKKADGRGKAQ